MSKDKRDTAAQSNNWPAYILAALLATLAGFFAVYVNSGPNGNRDAETSLTPPPARAPAATAGEGPLAGLNSGDMATFLVHRAPKDVPPVTFSNGEGARVSLADWRGKVVLLNLWATWCLPCLKEMPALDRLKAEIGGDKFDVVAISVDRGGIEKPRKFLQKIDAKNLALYHDGGGTLSAKLRVVGMPTTLLIDAKGREIGRLAGPAEWDSPHALRLMRAAISAGPTAP